ncbi:MAG: serine/threonine protein kinase [Myxococcales bacterium]|nr:serine/threonine protein kinase [Myxococcales bacterium]
MSTPSKGPLFRRNLDAGIVVDGRYEIVQELGRGGMGAVYEAHQVKLHKRVALKVLQADRARRDDGGASLKRFLREARAASSIKHRNVVDIIDFGDLEDGSTYYVMELLEGRDLSSLLKNEGPMPWPRARRLLRQVLGALMVAHDKGIIHRDIKPANVMLLDTPDEWGGEWVKVLDFGIAKVEESDEESQALTGTSELLGTAAYMAPELVRGDAPDARADLYAVGIMAYQLLTGSVPFSGANTFQVLLQQTSDPPRPPRTLVPELPPPVDAFVLRSLAKDPRIRFQSAAEMIEAIDVLGDSPHGELSISSGPIALADSGSSESLHPWPAGPGSLTPRRPGTSPPVTPPAGYTLQDPDLVIDPTPAPPARSRAVVGVLLLVVAVLAGLVAWLAAHDVARRTIRSSGLPRYMAVCMLTAYGWAAVAAGVWLTSSPADGDGAYDAVVHAVFLGFTLSMIMAHAPVILPAVVGRDLPYHPSLYVPVGLLHVSLLMRVWLGDGLDVPHAWRLGAVLNIVALLSFLGLAAGRVVAGGRR